MPDPLLRLCTSVRKLLNTDKLLSSDTNKTKDPHNQNNAPCDVSPTTHSAVCLHNTYDYIWEGSEDRVVPGSCPYLDTGDYSDVGNNRPTTARCSGRGKRGRRVIPLTEEGVIPLFLLLLFFLILGLWLCRNMQGVTVIEWQSWNCSTIRFTLAISYSRLVVSCLSFKCTEASVTQWMQRFYTCWSDAFEYVKNHWFLWHEIFGSSYTFTSNPFQNT